MSRAALVLILPVILAAACDAPRATPPSVPRATATTVTAALAPPALARPAVKLDGAQSLVDSATPRMLIRTGDASVEWIPLSRQSTRCISSRGGWAGGSPEPHLQVARISCAGHAAAAHSADRFGDAQSLGTLGRVEWVNVAAQDVGEEYVDLTARAANAERLERRLIDLLARRTGKLEDVLAVERELARVREEIERYEGRLRYLRTHVATSSLAVRVHERAPVIAGPGGTGLIGEAFRDAWRNFLHAIAGGIALGRHCPASSCRGSRVVRDPASEGTPGRVDYAAMTVDILAIAAHRDDVELTCAGTLIRAADAGHSTAILDLTGGESGTRGVPRCARRKRRRPAW